MKYKYIVLDFGRVLAVPPTGNWYQTPKFLELVDISKVDNTLLNDVFSKNREKHLKDNQKIVTLDEEYEMFKKFYYSVLSEINYDGDIKKLSDKIAYDRTYNTSKYKLCDNLYDELNILKEKYTLIMLTDNFPCIIPFLKEMNLDNYFNKVYVSSIYGLSKKDLLFFENVINDYNIKPGETLFIDDNESNLDNAKKVGFDCMLMDRNNNKKESKYKIINDLKNI